MRHVRQSGPSAVEQHRAETLAGLRSVRYGAVQRDRVRVRALRQHVDIDLRQVYLDEVNHPVFNRIYHLSRTSK